jgi:26S proteasome regulatory subunit N9
MKKHFNRLWHQLTLKCLQIVQKPELKQGNVLIEMYEKFITDFEHRINPLSLVEIALPVVRQYQDSNQAIKFLEKLKEKVKHEQQPSILINTAIGAIYLEQKNFELTKKCVEEVELELAEIDGVTTVHARFYELSSSYYRTIGNHCEYYKNALRYLGCIKFESLSDSEQKERAFYLSLAAILGDGIYNFGELVLFKINFPLSISFRLFFLLIKASTSYIRFIKWHSESMAC